MNRITRTALALLVAAGANLSAAEYLPLATGNQWTYQNTAVGASFTMAVGAAQEINGRTYYQLTGYANTPLFVRTDQSDLFYWDETLCMDLLLTSFEVAPGDYFVARQRPCGDSAGQVAESRCAHHARSVTRPRA